MSNKARLACGDLVSLMPRASHKMSGRVMNRNSLSAS
jgi:hypothetical protein